MPPDDEPQVGVEYGTYTAPDGRESVLIEVLNTGTATIDTIKIEWTCDFETPEDVSLGPSGSGSGLETQEIGRGFAFAPALGQPVGPLGPGESRKYLFPPDWLPMMLSVAAALSPERYRVTLATSGGRPIEAIPGSVLGELLGRRFGNPQPGEVAEAAGRPGPEPLGRAASTLRAVPLIDGMAVPRRPVSATVVRDMPSSILPIVEQAWASARRDLARHRAAQGRPAEHAHWNWRNKAGAARHRLVAVELDGIQGLMAVLRSPRPAYLPGPGPVLYVDFLEAAPWNLKGGPRPPKYLGVGTVLIAEATRLSQEAGLGGRVGLHALPQAEDFYRDRCGMTPLGRDDRYYDLAYFEYTGQQAADWLAATGQ